ncbi:salicylate hydroxylase [Roseobacter sp. GAI101]|nr:salicylate hydroxylase [Roseobacter sp. GAI101]
MDDKGQDMTVSNAIVIGAGIGGLAAAAALARRGMAVTLLEQAPVVSEVGAGLQISPNGMAVLRAMGLEAKLKERSAVRGQAVVLNDYKAGRQVARLDLMRGQADYPYMFVHRADLIDVLFGAAKRGNVSVELGAQVEKVVPGGPPTLLLADHARRRAELIVDAGGIHSKTRATLNGDDAAQFSGQVAWRALIPNRFDHPAEAHVTMGPGRHLVSYPLRGGKLINLVAVEERDTWAPEGWSIADNPANLRRAFGAFGGRAADMIAAVDHCTLWGLHHHPVASVWQQNGVALLGDAAHPTLPFLAQGANMALEDAWVLASCVLNQPIDQALRRYQSIREARVRRVIKTAAGNAARYHLHPGMTRTAAHLGLRLASRLAPGAMIGAFNWLYHHDVTTP